MAEELKSSAQIEQESFPSKAQKAKKQVKTFTDALATLASMGVGMQPTKMLKPHAMGKTLIKAFKHAKASNYTNPEFPKRLTRTVSGFNRYPQKFFKALTDVNVTKRANFLAGVQRRDWGTPTTSTLDLSDALLGIGGDPYAIDNRLDIVSSIAHEMNHIARSALVTKNQDLRQRMLTIHNLSKFMEQDLSHLVEGDLVWNNDPEELFAIAMERVPNPGSPEWEKEAIRAADEAIIYGLKLVNNEVEFREGNPPKHVDVSYERKTLNKIEKDFIKNIKLHKP